jgi:hypothetical protein
MNFGRRDEMKDLIQRLRSDSYMEDEVRSFAREAADALERLTAGDVKTPEQYYHVVSVYDGSINHIPYVKPEDAIDYGNRRAAAVLAERDALFISLRDVRNTLHRENAAPNGPIRDTIWHTKYETLFDFLDAAMKRKT